MQFVECSRTFPWCKCKAVSEDGRHLIEKLTKVQNCCARLILKTSKHAHASPLLTKLHWLPIGQRIEYKVSFMCYDVVSQTAPPHLSDLLHLYNRSLPSSADPPPPPPPPFFRIPKTKKTSKGYELYPIVAPSHAINSHTLYAMLQKIRVQNSKPHYPSQSMDHNSYLFVSAANHTPHPSPLFC